ncbi:TetR/AcrR family transcriptional regulator [Mycobacterium sp. Y57]|uniref:TetR/AcrR family transcriptional regulator n=1 Tax=Mycolicibacterium xanthum TaxID=2796469 RepID=UPI001C844E68|nr:TetR/AcrR family transcriptional regulator [Mycolicibacterium xanthum]MBX7435128.1 TetR/AcrR family transcriptional regulator [Mycolicibacterium xanthum]
MATADMLQATLHAFATHGYTGVSVRLLNQGLGVSHNLIYQRFGTKQNLWRAAVDHGFGELLELLNTDVGTTDPLDELSYLIRGFVIFSAAHPDLLGLVDIESRQDTDRLRYLYAEYIQPALQRVSSVLDRLVSAGRIRPVPLYLLHFLLTHGAVAPFTLVPMGALVDAPAAGDDAAVRRYADEVAGLIIRGLQISAVD